MKMNLSVVMGMKDKVSAPLKGMASESDHYAKAIKKIQKAQADDSAAMGMIGSFQNTKKAMNQNTIAIAAASEKLKELQAKATAAGKPTAALTEKIAKQQEKVNKLTNEQDTYKNHLIKLGGELKKTGVKVHDLDGENKRLEKSYKKHGAEVTKLSKKYAILKSAMSPLQKLNGAIRLPNLATSAIGKGTALVGGLSLAGFASTINSTAAEMDKLAKKSANLQLPISELQAMQSQAEHAGVSADSLSASMTRFTRRLGVLQQTGKGALGSYLKQSKNGLFKDLKGAENNQQAYEMLLESFSKLKTAQEQMAFADAAFGDSGREMLIMLREGTQGLTAAREELNALGGGATAEDAAKAEAYNDAMQRIQESIRSIKFAALAPVMEKATKLFTEFSNKFKNTQWRTEFMDKVIQTVNGLYKALEFLGKGLVFVSQNFKGIITTLAIFKVALIGINAVIMANPIGMMVAAIGAAIIAITYLVDKFVGLDKVISWVKEQFNSLWNGIKKLINMLPDALIPDGWKTDLSEAGNEVDNLANKLESIKDKNATLGITTNETSNQTERRKTYTDYQNSSLKTPSTYGQYQPLKSQTLNSKSEVSLTIKSEKPVTVDKAKSEKGTDLNLDVGDMGFSY
ncbi:hypothetical protein SBW85_19790 [Vibrio plantisponsor]|uniref:Phage tail tape measure protein n=1 Tax=Vibrio plantisponsor TaxID=664643 RepID=A0ABU4IN01_9VIBR|nr:hypothetical protein [Vibrio plantisponsor]MDW6019951.1 hypothetical protein [Vibrio plantisponsor]NNM42648.1 hypothetical protein [Vibrio plantisponsor]